MSAASHNPTRLLIPAGFGFSYITIRLVPENGWGPAALVGLLVLALILWGPAALKWACKNHAVRRAAKKKAEAEKKESGK
ncbi:hypothetical protein ACFY0G_40495 [Streptomyces sp. NPDC001552]|uniref:hypothetical protein n=1 Tax=Streptomyces sp. NPDC001552 TaxID=3364587 RepID=UPI0036895ECC